MRVSVTPLDSKLSAFFVDCENIIEPTMITAQKWVIVSDTQKQLQTVNDERASITISYARAIEKIKQLRSYEEAKAAFERDKVFSDGPKTAGYWATFDAVIQHLLDKEGKFKKNSIAINHAEALRRLRSLRETLEQRHLQYRASTRLLGVNLSSKSFSLPDGVTIHRLNRKEKNDRQPILQPFLSYVWEDEQLSNHPAELRASITVPVDRTQDGAFFKTKNDAYKVAKEIFDKILHAILVSKSGRAQLSYINLKGGLEQIPLGRPVLQRMPPLQNINLRKGDISKISIAYDLVSGGRKGDKTLHRALHRYILGRQRLDLVDKLVDYVIAWEAILLTQDGNPIPQELSYRFALNGASIITEAVKGANPLEIYKKMRSAYSARSTIVHGGEDKETDEALQVGEFKNLQELCNFLEKNFRSVIFWLASKKPKNRPYLKQGGWESLIWS